MKKFKELSRKRRNKMWIGAKNEITSECGVFTTDHVIDEGCDWVDIIFLGKTPGIFYNTTITTARYELRDLIFSKATEASLLLKPRTITFKKIDKLMSEMISSDHDSDIDWSEFDGIPRSEWIDTEVLRIVNDERISVNTSICIDNDYIYGIGLHVVIDTVVIDIDVIEKFINTFLENGEKSDKGSEVVATVKMMTEVHKSSNLLK